MTEQDWTCSKDPKAMLEVVQERGQASERKLRLFAVACCRLLWWRQLVDPRSRAAVEVGEQHADRPAEKAREAAEDPARRAMKRVRRISGWREAWAARYTVMPGAWPAATTAVKAASVRELASLASLLRDIFGPWPFRPPPAIDPAWLTGTVKQLAQAAYEERELPSGHLDRHRLAVLADSLEEAGCQDAELLGHLRSEVHVRGCWAIDRILGKE